MGNCLLLLDSVIHCVLDPACTETSCASSSFSACFLRLEDEIQALELLLGCGLVLSSFCIVMANRDRMKSVYTGCPEMVHFRIRNKLVPVLTFGEARYPFVNFSISLE